MTQMPKLVIWDWNGTLLNDVDICVQNFNEIVAKQNIPAVTKELFRSIYRHPVKGMYEDVGMKFSDSYTFSDLSDEWYEGYMEKATRVTLFKDAIPALSFFQKSSVVQILCSALEHEALTLQVTQNNIQTYFHEISGHHDLEAESKIERGVERWRSYNIEAAHTLMIGDSDHDLELAQAIGCSCALIDTGHQSLRTSQHRVDRTTSHNFKIYNSLQELLVFSFTAKNGNKN